MNLRIDPPRRVLAAIAVALIAGCGGGGEPAPEVRGWKNPFGSAAVVLGQTGFDQVSPQGSSATPIKSIIGNPAVAADGRLLVPAQDGVLVFADYDSKNGPVASLKFTLPFSNVVAGISVQGSKVLVAAGHNIYTFDSAPTRQTPPNRVVPDLDSIPGCGALTVKQPRSALLTPQGQLIVADSFNHRVLIWNSVPSSPSIPDLVLGQRHSDKCAANDDDGDGIRDQNPSARTFHFPNSVWSDGIRLVVADSENHRVLVWDTMPTATDPDSHFADHVIGQQNFAVAGANGGGGSPSASSLSKPLAVDVSAAGELAVVDSGNHRVLIWPSIPTGSGHAAAYVVGQSNFTQGRANDLHQNGTESAVPSAKTLKGPAGVRFDGRKLIVHDNGNDRVLVWREND